MPKKIVILCDERDAEIAGAISAALESRGNTASILACDASAETLERRTREEMAGAALFVVVLREGGRGARLLRAIEDEARDRAAVFPLIADASPDAAVSARTGARIHTLVDSIAAPHGGAVTTKKPNTKWTLIAAAVAAVALVALLAALRFWPSGPPLTGGPPVVLTGMRSNAGWIVTFHLKGDASQLEYKRPSDPDFVPTGDAGPGAGPNVGQPRAKTWVVLSDIRGRVPFLIRYKTLNGIERGPYEAVFDTTVQAVSSVKGALANIPDWISFRLFDGRRLCYFTTLVAQKYALRTIRYGIDSDVPNQTLRFVPSDTPGIHNEDQLFIDLPDDAGFVTVELTFLDDTKAGPKKFAVRY
jgi:hypothetical protein